LNDYTIEVERAEPALATEPGVGQSNGVLDSAELTDKHNGAEVAPARATSADDGADGQPFDTPPDVAPAGIQHNTAAARLESMSGPLAAEPSSVAPA
jgi:hypothetical protein